MDCVIHGMHCYCSIILGTEWLNGTFALSKVKSSALHSLKINLSVIAGGVLVKRFYSKAMFEDLFIHNKYIINTIRRIKYH